MITASQPSTLTENEKKTLSKNFKSAKKKWKQLARYSAMSFNISSKAACFSYCVQDDEGILFRFGFKGCCKWALVIIRNSRHFILAHGEV